MNHEKNINLALTLCMIAAMVVIIASVLAAVIELECSEKIDCDLQPGFFVQTFPSFPILVVIVSIIGMIILLIKLKYGENKNE